MPLYYVRILITVDERWTLPCRIVNTPGARMSKDSIAYLNFNFFIRDRLPFAFACSISWSGFAITSSGILLRDSQNSRLAAFSLISCDA